MLALIKQDKMNKILKSLVFVMVVLLQGCSNEEIIEDTRAFKTIENVQYNVVNFNSSIDICTQISNLTNNTYFEFTAGQVENISCNIIIENKSNIIINGNKSTLKYEDPNSDGFRIKILNCNNVHINDLSIDNNNTKANYVNDTSLSSGRIEVFNSNSIKLSSLNINKQKIVGNINGTVHQIYFKETTNSIINDCTLNSTDGELIMLKASKECLVKDNFLNEGWSGIATAGFFDSGVNKFGYNNRLIGNTISNSSTAFITVNDRNAIIEGNYIYNNDSALKHGPGIRFGHDVEYLYASNAICKNNIIENLKYPNGSYNPVGIKVDYSQSTESNQEYTDLIIEGNIIRNCQGGIKISNQSGQHLLIKDNEISTTTWPSIELFSTDSGGQTEPQNCFISNNVLSSEKETIKIYNSSVTITENHISSRATNINDQTIKIQNIYGSTGNYHNDIKIKNNIIELNGNNGIYYDQNNLESASILNNIIKNGNLGIYIGGRSNLIKDNLIQNCSNRSIYIRDGSSDNMISNNDIYNNFENAVYLHSTTRTSVIFNKFNFIGQIPYAYAVWKNSPATNIDCTIENNILNNFINESN